MSAMHELHAGARATTGKGAARKLRAAGRIPAVLYGPGSKPQELSIDAAEMRQALTTEYGNRILLRLSIDGGKEERYAILKDLQRHPLRNDVLHADLLAVELDRPVVIRVPLRPKPGIPFGVKNQGGVLEWMRRDVTIRVLPDKMPSYIDVDIEALELGQSLTAKKVVGDDFDLDIDDNTPICHVVATRMSLETVGAEGEEEGAEAEAEGAEGDEAEASGESAEAAEKSKD